MFYLSFAILPATHTPHCNIEISQNQPSVLTNFLFSSFCSGANSSLFDLHMCKLLQSLVRQPKSFKRFKNLELKVTDYFYDAKIDTC